MNGIPRSTYGSRGLANMRHMMLRRDLGDEHPAVRAALGRLLALSGMVPQRDSVTPEAVAWHRESGAIPGWRNRAARRDASRRARAEADAEAWLERIAGSP